MEVCRVRFHHLELLTYITLTDVLPFYLYLNPARPWLCPVTAIANWIDHLNKKKNTNGKLTGFVFRKKLSANMVSDDPNSGMVC